MDVRSRLSLVRIAVAVCAIGLAGCTSGVIASPSGATPSLATQAVADDCPTIELLTPSGVRVDLNGTWYANDDAYYSFLQIGNCVWATATTRLYVITLRGTVMSDFTVPIEFAYLAYRPGAPGEARNHGTATLLIEFDDGPDGEVINFARCLARCLAGMPWE